jgi:M6 family metalloprotease-like protein
VKQQFSKSFLVLLLIVIMVMPLVQSGVMANNSGAETESQTIRGLAPLADPVAPASPEIQYSGDPDGAYLPEPQLAPIGPQTLIVLLVYFSDLSYSESVPTLDSIIFGDVDDYYQEISFGQCSISGIVSGWYNLGHTVAYYGTDGATSGKTDDVDDDGDNDSYRLVDDAITAADPFVDFSSYGHIMVVHAGNGQESSGISTDIWSVRWSWTGHFVTDEKTFNSCSIVPETQDGDVDRCVGVIAHEFGHDIGLPDLYHVGHVGEDDFVDEWGLMASGSWNGIPAGASPAHPMAYCKIQLEWLTNYYEFESDSAYNVIIADQETYTTGFQAIKIITSTSSYYLVELRSNYGNDAYLPSTGVLISYCDESLGSGQGIVKVQDAHPGTSTLDDAAFQTGECFISDNLRIEVNMNYGDFAEISVIWKTEEWIGEKLVGTQSTEAERNPDIASDSSGNLYCAFETWNAGWGTYVIEVRKSIDGGRTWTWLFAFGDPTYDSLNPSIAVDVGFYDTIFVVCELEISASDHNIYGYAYNSTGAHFLIIDTDAENDRYPCIASEFSFGTGNYQYVAYERVMSNDDRDLVVQRSTTHGNTWSIVHQRGDLLDWNVYCDLSITCTRGSDGQYYVYVAYKYGADYASGTSVRVDMSTNYGGSWSLIYSVNLISEVHYTSIAAGHGTGTVVVAWHMYSDATWLNNIAYAYSTDDGSTWDVEWLSASSSDETYADIGVDGQGENASTVECPYFHIVYRVGNTVVYKRASANRPNIWSSAETVNSEWSLFNALRDRYNKRKWCPLSCDSLDRHQG